MPTLGVCTDSVLPMEGPLALMALIDYSLEQSRSKANDSWSKNRRFSRRSHKRTEFCYRLLIHPTGDTSAVESNPDSNSDSGEIYVTGKNISDVGLGFSHSEPIPFRRVRIEGADDRLEAIGLGDMSLEFVIRWCRFIAPGQYESGGSILWSKESLA